MKEGIHPEYREVVFQDMANGFKFITRSTVHTRETIKMDDGKEYPLMKLDVTSESHPFYTGAQQRIIETVRSSPAPAPLPPRPDPFYGPWPRFAVAPEKPWQLPGLSFSMVSRASDAPLADNEPKR